MADNRGMSNANTPKTSPAAALAWTKIRAGLYRSSSSVRPTLECVKHPTESARWELLESNPADQGDGYLGTYPTLAAAKRAAAATVAADLEQANMAAIAEDVALEATIADAAPTPPTNSTLVEMERALIGRTLHRTGGKTTTVYSVLWCSTTNEILLEGKDGVCVSAGRVEEGITGELFTWACIAQQHRDHAAVLRAEADEAYRNCQQDAAERLRREASWAEYDGSRYTDNPLPRPTC